MRLAMCCFAAVLSLPVFAQQKGTPSSSPKASVPELSPEAYRNLIVKTADAVSLLQNSVITGMHALQNTPVCFIDVDTAKAKLAAQATADYQKVWASQNVPKALQGSHAEILSWMGAAQSQYANLPACIYGGSMPLLMFFGTFGQYDDIRKNATTVLATMGVTLPPLTKNQ